MTKQDLLTGSPKMPHRRQDDNRRQTGGIQGRAIALCLVAAIGISACDGLGSRTEADYVEEARALMAEGSYAEARIQLRNAIQVNPDAPETRRDLGLTYLGLGDPESALVEFQRALDRGIEKAEIAVAMGRAQVETDQYEELRELPVPDAVSSEDAALLESFRAIGLAALGAEELAASALETANGYEAARAPVALARAHMALRAGDGESAGQWLNEAVTADPDFGPAWSLLGRYHQLSGNMEEAEAAFSRAVETRMMPGMDYVRRAMVRLEREDYGGVEEDVRRLRDAGSSHPALNYLQAILHLQEEAYRDARREFEEALALNRNFAPALLGLGQVHKHQGNLEQAEHFLTRHLSQSPDSLQGLHALAELYHQDGRTNDAIATLRRAERGPRGNDPDYLSLLGRYKVWAGDLEGGISALRKAVAADPASPELQEMLAFALLQSGDMDGGIGALQALGGLDTDVRPGDTSLIMLLLQQGRNQEAITRAEELLERHPDLVELHTLISIGHIGLGDTESARAALRKGLVEAPENASLALNLASLEEQLGNLAEAREVLEALQQRLPGEHRSAQHLASLAFQEGDSTTAMQWLQKATEHSPEVLQPHITLARMQVTEGRPDAARDTLEQAKEFHPDEPELHHALGTVQHQLGQYDDAVTSFLFAVEQAPDNANARLSLARSQASSGDDQAAEDTLKELLEMQPGHQEARVFLIRGLMNQNRFEAADRQVDKFREHYPDSALGYGLGGMLALDQGEFEQARDRFLAALERTETPSRDWVMGLVQAKHSLGETEASLSVLSEWAEENPGDAPAWHLYGARLLEQGKSADALEVYETFLERFPDDAIALNNAAWLLRHQDVSRGLEYVRRAHANAPESPQVMDTKGVLLIHGDQAEEAVEVLRKANELAPDDLTIRYHLAWAMAKLGNDAQAREELSDLLAVDEQFPERDEAADLLDRLTQAGSQD